MHLKCIKINLIFFFSLVIKIEYQEEDNENDELPFILFSRNK